jgi:DeoR/GlpR family transcriptional regulator of sugar metabolism
LDLKISSLERQREIQGLIESEKRISIPSICETFSISEATARRDLESLESEGKIRRVRGGAIIIGHSPPELPILERENEQSELKEPIGRATASLIEPGDTVFLGSGTTVLAAARNLYNCEDLTVLTNSLPIINLLIGCSGIDLVVFGGLLRESELSFIGHITESALEEVRADKVIIGTRAISLDAGITNDYMPETQTDRAILKIGQQVILAVDKTKFETISTAFLAPLEDIDVIVTNTGVEPKYVKSLEEKGIQVILAN